VSGATRSTGGQPAIFCCFSESVAVIVCRHESIAAASQLSLLWPGFGRDGWIVIANPPSPDSRRLEH
jgi:hypothetical protein